MVEIVEMNQQHEEGEKKVKPRKFSINDHVDVLTEILTRLDGHSLGAAACVCRLWLSIVRNDYLWEHLCFRHVSPPPPGIRPVVAALGGYRRLYLLFLRPVLSRVKAAGKKRLRGGVGETEVLRRVWRRHEVELSLSLFCIDYYERLGGGGGGGSSGGGRHSSAAKTSSSLMFLCEPVNV